MKKALRILSLLLVLLTLAGIAGPAMAAEEKPKIVTETLWAGCEYFGPVGIINLSDSARIISIKSGSPKVIKPHRDGPGLYDNYLEPLKPGKAKITVKYRDGGKSGTLSATYTVKKYPNPLSYVKVNGQKINIKGNKYYYDVNKYKKTSATIVVKPAKGWKIMWTWGYTEKADGSDFQEFEPRSGKAFKIKKGRNAGAFFTLVNEQGDFIQYGIHFYRG